VAWDAGNTVPVMKTSPWNMISGPLRGDDMMQRVVRDCTGVIVVNRPTLLGLFWYFCEIDKQLV
jgi:hypothetical protein